MFKNIKLLLFLLVLNLILEFVITLPFILDGRLKVHFIDVGNFILLNLLTIPITFACFKALLKLSSENEVVLRKSFSKSFILTGIDLSKGVYIFNMN